MRRNNNEKHEKGEQRVKVGVKDEGEGRSWERSVCGCVCAHMQEREDVC